MTTYSGSSSSASMFALKKRPTSAGRKMQVLDEGDPLPVLADALPLSGRASGAGRGGAPAHINPGPTKTVSLKLSQQGTATSTLQQGGSSSSSSKGAAAVSRVAETYGLKKGILSAKEKSRLAEREMSMSSSVNSALNSSLKATKTNSRKTTAPPPRVSAETNQGGGVAAAGKDHGCSRSSPPAPLAQVTAAPAAFTAWPDVIAEGPLLKPLEEQLSLPNPIAPSPTDPVLANSLIHGLLTGKYEPEAEEEGANGGGAFSAGAAGTAPASAELAEVMRVLRGVDQHKNEDGELGLHDVSEAEMQKMALQLEWQANPAEPDGPFEAVLPEAKSSMRLVEGIVSKHESEQKKRAEELAKFMEALAEKRQLPSAFEDMADVAADMGRGKENLPTFLTRCLDEEEDDHAYENAALVKVPSTKEKKRSSESQSPKRPARPRITFVSGDYTVEECLKIEEGLNQIAYLDDVLASLERKEQKAKSDLEARRKEMEARAIEKAAGKGKQEALALLIEKGLLAPDRSQLGKVVKKPQKSGATSTAAAASVAESEIEFPLEGAMVCWDRWSSKAGAAQDGSSLQLSTSEGPLSRDQLQENYESEATPSPTKHQLELVPLLEQRGGSSASSSSSTAASSRTGSKHVGSAARNGGSSSSSTSVQGTVSASTSTVATRQPSKESSTSTMLLASGAKNKLKAHDGSGTGTSPTRGLQGGSANRITNRRTDTVKPPQAHTTRAGGGSGAARSRTHSNAGVSDAGSLPAQSAIFTAEQEDLLESLLCASPEPPAEEAFAVSLYRAEDLSALEDIDAKLAKLKEEEQVKEAREAEEKQKAKEPEVKAKEAEEKAKAKNYYMAGSDAESAAGGLLSELARIRNLSETEGGAEADTTAADLNGFGGEDDEYNIFEGRGARGSAAARTCNPLPIGVGTSFFLSSLPKSDGDGGEEDLDQSLDYGLLGQPPADAAQKQTDSGKHASDARTRLASLIGNYETMEAQPGADSAPGAQDAEEAAEEDVDWQEVRRENELDAEISRVRALLAKGRPRESPAKPAAATVASGVSSGGPGAENEGDAELEAKLLALGLLSQ
mmetsp:Transcript_23698/g.59860  ORF Transcript_23698/g.59860 Transcript_23698/m.59860 type:complete len:1074 (+) Transcript_23698:105-3326(+)